jgi:hypothetical protein
MNVPPLQGSMFLPSDPRVSELASLALPPWALFFRAFGAPLQLKSQGSRRYWIECSALGRHVDCIRIYWIDSNPIIKSHKYSFVRTKNMKSKVVMMMIPLLIGWTFASSAQAKSHKIRVKMTGCLEKGAEPDTYILNNITKSYTRRNTTGQAPLMLARGEGFVFKAKGDVDDLEAHVGERVSVTGWLRSEDAANDEDMVSSCDSCTCNSCSGVSPAPTSGFSEFTVTDVDGSGNCQVLQQEHNCP